MITRESLRAADACWTDDRIAALVPTEGITPRQLADGYASAGVSHDDAHWALCCAAGVSDRTLREHACWCARQALALVAEPDPRSVAAVDVAERYARGEATVEELAAARAAALAAAWDAALAAALAAAWDAALAAAWAAAWNAARVAAWSTASAAALAAASDAAWDAQIRDLAERIEKQETTK